MRGARLATMTNQALQSPQLQGKVNNVNFFGHSLSGEQDQEAADAVQKANPGLHTEAYVLNPGGLFNPKPNSDVTDIRVPGEILGDVGIATTSPKEVNLQLSPQALKQASGIMAPIELHGTDLPMQDLKTYEGVPQGSGS